MAKAFNAGGVDYLFIGKAVSFFSVPTAIQYEVTFVEGRLR